MQPLGSDAREPTLRDPHTLRTQPPRPMFFRCVALAAGIAPPLCGHVRHVFHGAESRRDDENSPYIRLTSTENGFSRGIPGERRPMSAAVVETAVSPRGFTPISPPFSGGIRISFGGSVITLVANNEQIIVPGASARRRQTSPGLPQPGSARPK